MSNESIFKLESSSFGVVPGTLGHRHEPGPKSQFCLVLLHEHVHGWKIPVGDFSHGPGAGAAPDVSTQPCSKFSFAASSLRVVHENQRRNAAVPNAVRHEVESASERGDVGHLHQLDHDIAGMSWLKQFEIHFE